MTEKKATKAATTKKSTAAKKTATKKTAVKGSVVLNAENVGFKAGDVYQALATAEKPMSVAEIAKSAKITEDEVLVGMGWLFKEEDDKVVLA